MTYDNNLDRHRDDALLENVAFLESVGLHREQITRRVGKSWDTIEKARARRKARREQPHPTKAAGAGEGEAAGQVPPLRIASTEG